jgi:fatty-acyl-CoA synthase
VLIVDASLMDDLQRIAPLLETVEHFVVIGEADSGALSGVVRYEELLSQQAPGMDWPDLDERAAAALCYTSGTSGNPKGVLYTHRSLALHALIMSGHDTYRLGESDRVLAVVPMFHAMGWNVPYIAGLIGTDLILPRRYLQPQHLARLIAGQRVTSSAGVPTVWMDLLHYADEHANDLSSLEVVICGGTQVPSVLMHDFEAHHGVKVIQGWGMTETFPGAVLGHEPPGADEQQRWAYREMAGRISPFYEIRVVDDAGTVLASDGVSTGEIEVRGPAVASGYYDNAHASAERIDDGWLRTGDIGTVDDRGWLRITDRAKDVIKSGGEWISSVDLESALMAHPNVVEAAVIGSPDSRWSERPLACVVTSKDTLPGELNEFLSSRVAKWWLPDEYAFLPQIPKTSVGKFDKKALRDLLAQDLLPERRRVG